MNPAEQIPGTDKFASAGRSLRDVRFELPPGFVGNPNATPRCNYHDFISGGGSEGQSLCPNDTAVGEATTTVSFQIGEEFDGDFVSQYNKYTDPVFNVETPGGIAAEFGFLVEGDPVSSIPGFARAPITASLSTCATSPRQRRCSPRR